LSNLSVYFKSERKQTSINLLKGVSMSTKKAPAAKKPEEKKPLARSLTPQADKAKAAKAPAAPAAPAKKAKPAPYVAPQADVDANAAAPEAAAVPEPPKTKKVKAPKEPKAPRESRTGMIVDMLLAQNSTDEDIYEAVKAKFGDFAKNQISICRCDLNDQNHPKYKAKKEAAGFDNTKTRIVQLIPAPEETPPAVA
jgi:hypothetical protein